MSSGNREQFSTLFVHGFSVHFYLRNKRAKRYTSVVAVIRHGDERIKFSLPLQVSPANWDKRCERIYLHDEKSIEYNRVLSTVRCDIENLCVTLQDVEKVKTYVLERFDMSNKKHLANINIEGILRKAFRLYYDEQKARNKVKDTTVDNKKHQLDKLCQIIKEMGCNNSRKFLSQNGYNQLKDFVIDYYGGYTSGATQKCALFAMLLNYIKGLDEFEKFHIEQIVHENFYTQSKFKTNLLDDEIKALEDVQLDDKQENNARYLFLIETECGSRNSDIATVIEKTKELKTGEVKAYTELKEGRTAVAVNTEKLQFYKSQLTEKYKNISCTYANELLKKIARKANLCRIIETMGNEPLHDCISTHFGRHTFITNMRKKGYSEHEVIKFTGHASEDMVKKIYAHLSDEDHEADARRLIEQVENKGKQSAQSTTLTPQRNNSYLIDGIEEALSVAKYLGLSLPPDTIETKSFNEIISMIEARQQQLRDDCGVDVLLLKALFNQSLPLKKRVKALCSVLEVLTDR